MLSHKKNKWEKDLIEAAREYREWTEKLNALLETIATENEAAPHNPSGRDFFEDLPAPFTPEQHKKVSELSELVKGAEKVLLHKARQMEYWS